MTMPRRQPHLDTLAAGNVSGSRTAGPLTTPIVASSTFILESCEAGAQIALRNENTPGFIYTRWDNPTTASAASVLASLESPTSKAHALITSSGMAAITTFFLTVLSRGDHAVIPQGLYGGVVSHFGPRLGINFTTVDATDPANYTSAIRAETKLLYMETPCNPNMRLTDLRAVARIGAEANILTAVDSTFASPANQRPLELGVDVVLHSCTKYLGGHSDLTAGSIVTRKLSLYEACHRTMRTFGGCISPFESFLLIRGMKTLPVRVERQNQTAKTVALYLQKHPKVKAVNYPGLPDHPDYQLGQKQMTGSGGMVSFEVHGGVRGGRIFMESLKLVNLAVSLGGVESLAEHPATMTHTQMTSEERLAAGIPDGLIRLSLGLEDANDLLRDLGDALANIQELSKL